MLWRWVTVAREAETVQETGGVRGLWLGLRAREHRPALLAFSTTAVAFVVVVASGLRVDAATGFFGPVPRFLVAAGEVIGLDAVGGVVENPGAFALQGSVESVQVLVDVAAEGLSMWSVGADTSPAHTDLVALPDAATMGTDLGAPDVGGPVLAPGGDGLGGGAGALGLDGTEHSGGDESPAAETPQGASPQAESVGDSGGAATPPNTPVGQDEEDADEDSADNKSGSAGKGPGDSVAGSGGGKNGGTSGAGGADNAGSGKNSESAGNGQGNDPGNGKDQSSGQDNGTATAQPAGAAPGGPAGPPEESESSPESGQGNGQGNGEGQGNDGPGAGNGQGKDKG